ncbi:uncharacterized protein LOC124499051 [Dermatophagoides farinae]|uniref:uncharacterized protein LOC124499051 n=1 Tax=Dermatophagoides farinae TaxID=6954 RepID=UPI003F60702B
MVITYRIQLDDDHQTFGDNDNIDDGKLISSLLSMLIGKVKSFGTDEMSNMNRPLTAINNNRMANIIINVQRIILSAGGGGGGDGRILDLCR